MKLIVLGSARHGKDTVCGLLRDMYGLTFISSSYFVAEKAVRPWLANKFGVVYPSLEDCYNDRINHRSGWFDAIADYISVDATRLGRELFAQYDIYCGPRNFHEYQALKAEKAFDCCLWVDRSRWVAPEKSDSFNIPMSVADYIIDNNSDISDLEINILEVMDRAMSDGKIEYREPTFIRS